VEPVAAAAAAAGPGPSLPEQIVFWFLALAIVAGALFTMTRKNPVTAVMSLVGTFFALAALYATLSAHFLAIIQILVYAGAIMVLFIFVVMILNREEVTPVTLRGLGLRLMGVGGGLYLVWVFFDIVRTPGQADLPRPVPESFGTVAAIGDLLFRDFLYPFESISLLLLVAIVGGVVISRSHQKEAAAVLAAERRAAIRKMSGDQVQGLLDDTAADAHGGGHH
jgi:NADH-quinone oxidoreductase subunit J